ncbi:hypothetical protein BKA83DRAFT_25098 [Pisolithus microcarpus]|nr:hypothetical protein BKA83DRAFT_25098 [Pisolithus microcarpus]
MDENGTKGNNTEEQDSHNSSVDSEYKQPSSSRKCKLKATTSSRKLKIISTDDSGDELPLATMKEASRECSESVPTEEQTIYQRPKPRPTVNRLLQNNTEDSFSLCTRYHPTRFPAVNTTGTLSVTSVQLLSAEEGLVDKILEGDTMSDSSCDAPQEVPGHHAIRSPQPPLASYDAANPFAHPPYTQLPENIPDRLPGPAMWPLHAQQLDTSQGNNHAQYNFDNAASWYTAQQGPYVPMPYIPQPFRHPYPLPDLRGHASASIPESEHMDNGIHNAAHRYHDTYYPGMVNSGEQYRLAYREPIYYPFHPPRPPLVCPGPISHLDGSTNAPPSTTHRQNVFGGDKDVQENRSI